MELSEKRVSPAQRKATDKYLEKFDEIRIRIPKGGKDDIKRHAERQGESMNEFVKRAISEVGEMDSMHCAYQRRLLRHLEKAKNAIENSDAEEAKKILSELIEDTKNDIGE